MLLPPVPFQNRSPMDPDVEIGFILGGGKSQARAIMSLHISIKAFIYFVFYSFSKYLLNKWCGSDVILIAGRNRQKGHSSVIKGCQRVASNICE